MNLPAELSRLAASWQASGLREGDTVLIHSSIVPILVTLSQRGWIATARDILESFRLAVGREGTLLLPLFNFGFARGEPFDIRSTPSKMGALTEAARLHSASVRTGHPIYSFAVLGRHAEAFRGLENFSAYGPDSPFARLRELGGKIAVLNLPDQQSMTSYHHVEEMEGAPYRYHKVFRGLYTGWDGHASEREFGMFVRDLDKGVVTLGDPMGERLWQLGLYHGSRWNEGNGLRVIEAQALYQAVAEVIRAGQALGVLYRLESR
jgi:aminoglycoside 3-N-acetyltransferase